MAETLLLEIIIVLLGALLALLGYMGKWHLDSHKKMNDKLDLINTNCADYTENRESHNKIWGQLDKHTNQLSAVSARVAVLENKAHGITHANVERTNNKR